MTTRPASPPTLTNDQLVAFCEEVAALARAGVPLEKGLVALAADLPGRLGSFADAIGQRLEQGEPLERILDLPAGRISPVFRAAVLAGLRGGRLAIALEGMAATLRKAQELRRLTRAALVYPLFVATLAFLVFLGVASTWEVSLIPAYERLRIGENLPLVGVGFFGRTARYWLLAPPLLLGVVFGGLWWRSRKVQWTSRGGDVRNWATPGRLLRCGRLSTFADVLALLIDQRVPLAEAVVLAGDASGDTRISNWAAIFASRLEQGEPPAKIGDARGVLPPLLAWRIAAGIRQGELSTVMRRAADEYRREADRLHVRLTVSLPLIFTLIIGGGATLLYAVSVLTPWVITVFQLATTN